MSAYLNLLITKGITFNPVFTWTDSSGNPVDLTGYKARMQIRPEKDDPTILVSLSTEDTPPEIVLGGTGGTIAVTLSAETTLALVGDGGVYDLEVYEGTVPNEVVVQVLRGNVPFETKVTQA